MKRVVKKYSLDLKKEVIAYLEKNGLQKAAKKYKISPSTIQFWPKQLEEKKRKKNPNLPAKRPMETQSPVFFEVKESIINDMSMPSGCNIEIHHNGSLVKVSNYPAHLINFSQFFNL